MGTLDFIRQMFPPKATFSVDDIPDLSGQVMIVTGANAGIGKETARALLVHNAKVYMTARDRGKAEAAIKELKAETGKEGIFLELDLADLRSIERAAEEFKGKETELHVLFNNAGVWCPPIDLATTQGYDLQFGTNVLGHWYLTKLLLPALITAAKSSPKGKARVIHSSSSGHLLAKGIKYDTLKDTPARRKLSTEVQYVQSKLGNNIVSNEFARRYGDEGIVSVSLHPGNVKSDIQRHVGRLRKAAMIPIQYPLPMGALTQLYAGTSDEGLNLNGKYLIPWARVGCQLPIGLDQAAGEQLWTWLEDQVSGT